MEDYELCKCCMGWPPPDETTEELCADCLKYTAALKAENTKLREALKWYADINVWVTADGDPPPLGYTQAGDDCGAKAREALGKTGPARG